MSSERVTAPLLAKEYQGDDDEEQVPYRPARGVRGERAKFGQLALAALVGGLAVSVCSHLGLPSALSLAWNGSLGCGNHPSPQGQAPYHNVWKNIDISTAVSIREWLMAPERHLNLTSSHEAQESDNWIQLVEAHHPPKELALGYLSNSSSLPPRYAHAIIHHGPDETIVDYLIGPLPVSPKTTLRPITESYHNLPIPLNAHASFNWTRLGQHFAKAFLPLDPVTRDLFNGSVLDESLAVAGIAPVSYDGSWRRTWLQLRRNGPGSWLRPLDLFAYVDMTGTDPNAYSVTKVVHNKQLYPSIPAFLAAWEAGNLTKALPEESSAWSTRKPRSRARDLDDKPGPRQVAVGGARYRVDHAEQWVSWMGWDFFIGFQRDMGVHLWNIKLFGERLIYEISPQEAMAQYSGFDPHQASTVWLDSAFGMGSNVRDVILGYDCPADATLLPALVHELGSTLRRNAICVFEREGTRPLSRHLGYERDEAGAVKWYELIVRSVSTVGNYDYIFDYTFQLDGTIEIRVSASGYLQGGLWQPEQNAYGHQLSRDGMGSLHDHVINYKVDFDVAGVRNSLMSVELAVEDKHEPWFEDGWGSGTKQQRIERKILPTETTLDYPPNMQGAYVVINQNATNQWNNPRGYAIHPGPLCRLTNLDSKRTERNVEWAKSHLGVSRTKDAEGRSSSGWNMNLPGKPAVDYGRFFDNESIEQEDLVVWLNLGTHHIPRAEDTPNTLTNVATSYVSLIPWNYFDEDISMDSQNSVLINKDKDGRWSVDERVKTPPSGGKKLSWNDVEEWDEKGQKVKTKENGHLNKVVLGGLAG